MSTSYSIMSDLLALYKADQISEGKKVRYFVSHPNEESSEMYATTEEGFKTLRNAFAPKTSYQLKLDYYDLYHLSLEILNKRRRLKYDEYEEIITRHNADPLEASGLLDVWDNYIYHVTRQTDLDTLEVCSNLLLVNFWLDKIVAPLPEGDNKEYHLDLKRKLNARIIFPVFLLSEQVPGEISENDGLVDTRKIKSIRDTLKALKAKAELEELEELEKDLNNAKRKYNRVESRRFDEYNNVYEQEYRDYQELIENSEFTVSEDEEDESGNPAIPYGSIIEDSSSLPPPPVYDYTPIQEFDVSMLNNSLSARSRQTFDKIREDDMDGYDYVLGKLELRKQELAGIINDNTGSSSQMISIGGVPVRPGKGGGEKGLYGIEAICLNAEENIWQFVVVLYIKNILKLSAKLRSGNATIANDTPIDDFKASDSTGILLFKSGVKIPEPVPSNLILNIVYHVVPGKLEFLNIPIVLEINKETIDKGDSGQETETGEGDDVFSKPNLYGVTRLGVGEYLKINQQLCCYVPGEVSHIENIMAREYKEKSTKLLKRSEETVTSEITFESEQSTDTSSTDRNELSSELSTMEQQSRNYNFSVGGGFGPVSANMSLSFNNSKEKSYSLASTRSQELVQKAVERIVSKTREERVRKIINEYTEENKHGYDNRDGENHINGVYRWVDKVYKNQLVNYGMRLMYEFMIPEPASLHQEYVNREYENKDENNTNIIEKPTDPRTAKENPIANYEKINEKNSAFWANAFGVEIDPKPIKDMTASESYSGIDSKGKGAAFNFNSILIPDGYKIDKIKYTASLVKHGVRLGRNANFDITILSKKYKFLSFKILQMDREYTSGTVPISVNIRDYKSFTVNVEVQYTLTTSRENEWKKKTFDAIIKGYERKLNESKQNIEAEQIQVKEKLAVNPNFYREIEMNVLKKNCIAYLYEQMGKPPKNLITRGSFASHHVQRDKDFENYASIVKFFEQAFEWEIMSYVFYPFYWAEKEQWEKLYYENIDDLLFRNFLQSGMGRVIVSVRPGFEEAVMWYMKTGQIWNGSNPPVIGDEMYLSIVDELTGFEPEQVIEEWEVKIPSTLTVLQTGGVDLGSGSLPCYCEEDNSEEFIPSSHLIGIPVSPTE